MFLTILACVCTVAVAASAQIEFRVGVDPNTASNPVSGRLLVFLIKEGANIRPGTEPIEGPFWDDPQPLFGIDATNLSAESPALVNAQADRFPAGLATLSPGRYRAQARLDVHREDSNWRRHDGNLYSDVAEFAVVTGAASPPIPLTLAHSTTIEPEQKIDGVEWFEVRSKLLSDFRGHDVMLRAGVVLPSEFDASKRYAAVYEVPGFGGNHLDAARVARARARSSGDPALAKSTFWIVLDPEGPNGHTLFTDSANNGPCGEALVTELIPALEGKYNLIADTKGRLLRGHSSGGWSTIWLATTYPQTFGACWSSSPDPVDFRRFQLVNIYEQPNMYVGDAGEGKIREVPSYRGRGSLMTVRQESRGEDVLGPDNTSAQQWDSWFACFGPRNERGHPRALFDAESGAIDHAVAEFYRAYDITDRLRKEPSKYAPILHERVRLVVGEQDSFYLNEAVGLLQAELRSVSQPSKSSANARGYITIVPNHDHGTIFGTKEVRNFPREMSEHLDRAGLLVR